MADLHIDLPQVRNYSFRPIILIIFIYKRMHVLFNNYFHHVCTYVCPVGPMWICGCLCLCVWIGLPVLYACCQPVCPSAYVSVRLE
jgi:hypothetical protein